MMRRLVAVTLAVVCLSPSKSAFAGSVLDQTPAERTASLKQQVVGIPAGAVIEVKLQQKGSRKITGKLGSITDEGFEVQTVSSGQVSSQRVAFADVKSVKEKHGMSVVTKVLIVTGIVVAVSAALTGILIAAGPPSN
jgi:diphthamide synthase (EF-2-diphthine--ammonia ligase)